MHSFLSEEYKKKQSLFLNISQNLKIKLQEVLLLQLITSKIIFKKESIHGCTKVEKKKKKVSARSLEKIYSKT